MKMVMKIVVLLCLTLAISCTHKELCMQHPHALKVKVLFDWKKAPDTWAKGMCILFYPLDGEGRYRFDFDNIKGGEVEIKAGKYRVICHNNDTESLLYTDTDVFESYKAYTREGNVLEPILGNSTGYTSKANGAEEEKVVLSPDMIWGCVAFDVNITDRGIEYTCTTYSEYIGRQGESVMDLNHVMTLYPRELTTTYTYEVRNVKNLKHISQMCGTLSGLSGMMTLFNEGLSNESVTIPFEAFSDGESTVTGKFYTFGYHPENRVPHKMVFYVVMDDGAKYCFKDTELLNVTSQVKNAPDRKHVHIVIDGLELPQPIENGHGFRPTMDDWIVEEKEIQTLKYSSSN